MATMKSKDFIAKAKDIAENYNTLYVKGCFGAPLTGSNVSRYCTNHSYNEASERTAMIKAVADKNPPYYGFDCVCLIKGILWGWAGDKSKTYGGATYASNSVPDVNADGMIGKCKDVSESGWSDMVPGEAVWMSGHIGIYIGDGLAAECTPKWTNNVQITAVGNIGAKSGYNKRTWTKHGKLPYVDYSDQTVTTAAASKDSNAASSGSSSGSSNSSGSSSGSSNTTAVLTIANTVKAVQTWLNKYYSTGLTVDNVYGAKTKAALVKAWQKEVGGLTVDGIFGTKSKTKAASTVIKNGSTGIIVTIWQAFLVCKGYSISIDGDFGSKTTTATKSFQKANSLTQDGQVGKNTWTKAFA